MIDLDSSPARYRGTIEVYAEVRLSDEEDFSSDLVVEWRWRCRSNNHTILGHGEGYRRKDGALNAIDAMFGAKLFFNRRPVSIEHSVVPWRLVIVDRHGNTTTGAVY